MVLCLRTSDPLATKALASALSKLMSDGDLVVLSGEMGAGKTCFTQGLAQGLGVTDRVTSPTFTLANRYEGRLVLNHLDVFRLDDPSETLDLDLPELLESGVTVIEWGEQIAAVLPADHLAITIGWVQSEVSVGSDDERQLIIDPNGPRWIGRTSAMAQALADWAERC